MASIHPAITVSNIRNYIPITLEAENGQYTSWVELFKIHCRAFDVYDHIIPDAALASSSTSKPDKETETATPTDAKRLWRRLDAIVLQWIYGTISKDLLVTILTPNTTASDAWKALEHVFVDSKPTRAIHLKQKLATVKLEQFSNMSAYCQEVKSLADQLTNVDSPVDNQSLVLQLISGLSEQYDGIATLLQQSTPLPDFYTTRSKLCMEESRKASQTPPTALQTTATKPAPHQPSSYTGNTNHGGIHTGRGTTDGRGRGRNSRGRGRSVRGRGRGYYPGTTYSYPPSSPYHPSQQWTPPPVPYPTAPPSRPPFRPPTGHGILGSGPSHAYAATEYSYTPTNIEHAMHTMSLNPPDSSWYLDTGATNHMSNTTGTFSTYCNNNIP